MVGTSPPRCLLASDTEGVVAPQTMNIHRGKNRKISPPHLGWKPRRTPTQLPALGEVFVLTSPFIERGYRIDEFRAGEGGWPQIARNSGEKEYTGSSGENCRASIHNSCGSGAQRFSLWLCRTGLVSSGLESVSQ